MVNFTPGWVDHSVDPPDATNPAQGLGYHLSEDVLIRMEGGSVAIGWLIRDPSGGRQWIVGIYNPLSGGYPSGVGAPLPVTHWMRLPAQPAAPETATFDPRLPESWPAQSLRWRDPSDVLPMDREACFLRASDGGWDQSVPVLALVQRDHGGTGPIWAAMAVARDNWDEDAGVFREWREAGQDMCSVGGRVLAWASAPIPAHLAVTE